MNSSKMFLSLVPWLVFSVLVHRMGAEAAGLAALAAAALGVFFIIRNLASGIKIIDIASVVTFGLLAAGCAIGDSQVSVWVADYGRGASALLLGLIMLASTLAVPFSEQFARETVPAEYWTSPVFRAVNRKISALWGILLLIMGVGHLIAGALVPTTSPVGANGPLELLLNWIVPAGLIMLGVSITRQIAGRVASPAGTDAGDPVHANDEQFHRPGADHR